MSDHIRWTSNSYDGFLGHVGTVGNWLFQIWHCGDCSGEWSLMMTGLGGSVGEHFTSDDIAELKRRAEKLLRQFASSLGAVFPDADRWQALTDWLGEQADDHGVPPEATSFVHDIESECYRHVLAKMRELEAGQ